MTTITLDRTNQAHSDRRTVVSSLGRAFITSFKEFCAGVRDGQEIHDLYRAYSRMHQVELARIGITRADGYRAALLGRPG